MQKQIMAVAIAALAMTTGAEAAVSVITTQAAFSAAGTIIQNTNFDTNGAGFTTPGSPYNIGALTFVEGGQNLIGGISGYGMARSLFTDNYVQGTTVGVAGLYDLFGFNAGNFFSAGTTVIDIATNLGFYQFTPATQSYANNGTLTFLGYQAFAGEYFTSVKFSGGQATGGTDFQIGVAGAVPEPTSWAMLIAGFGLTGAAMRRRRTTAVIA